MFWLQTRKRRQYGLEAYAWCCSYYLWTVYSDTRFSHSYVYIILLYSTPTRMNLKSNIIKITLLTLLSGLLFLSSSYAQSLKKEVIAFTREHAIHSYEYNSGSIILFQPRRGGLTSEFSTKWTSAKFLTSLKNNCVAINWFYFWRGIDGNNFQPAGPVTRYVGFNRQPIIIPSTTNPQDDVNLWVEVFYNSSLNSVSMNTPIKINRGVSFFAWPMIIQDGEINTDLSRRISHRSTNHFRTFLIQDNRNRAIRWITTTKISLPDLARALQTIMKWKVKNIVNLDGWSSTSFSSSGFSYNTSKALPSFFHSCK